MERIWSRQVNPEAPRGGISWHSFIRDLMSVVVRLSRSTIRRTSLSHFKSVSSVIFGFRRSRILVFSRSEHSRYSGLISIAFSFSFPFPVCIACALHTLCIRMGSIFVSDNGLSLLFHLFIALSRLEVEKFLRRSISSKRR